MVLYLPMVWAMGIWLTVASDDADKDANMRTKISPAFINSTSFGILQATRTRISKTDYISCPSCGRTLFYLQDTTARIRSRTAHLKGLKIGIMGCIVNGPVKWPMPIMVMWV